jgi:hypothetical protein
MEPQLDFDYLPHVIDPIFPIIFHKEINIKEVNEIMNSEPSIDFLKSKDWKLWKILSSEYSSEFFMFNHKIEDHTTHFHYKKNYHIKGNYSKRFIEKLAFRKLAFLNPFLFIQILAAVFFDKIICLIKIVYLDRYNKNVRNWNQKNDSARIEVQNKINQQRLELNLYINQSIIENWSSIKLRLCDECVAKYLVIKNSILQPELSESAVSSPQRGYSEDIFFSFLKEYLPDDIEVLQNIKLGKFFPDIVIRFGDGFYIDVEIDEPYIYELGKPIHYVYMDKFVHLFFKEQFMMKLELYWELSSDFTKMINKRLNNKLLWTNNLLEGLDSTQYFEARDAFHERMKYYELVNEQFPNSNVIEQSQGENVYLNEEINDEHYDNYLYQGDNDRLRPHPDDYKLSEDEYNEWKEEMGFDDTSERCLKESEFDQYCEKLIWFEDVEIGLANTKSIPYENQCYVPFDKLISKDRDRDQFFMQSNWIVIRFSESQVLNFEMDCILVIMNVINRIMGCAWDKNINHTPKFIHRKWTRPEAELMALGNSRKTF